MVEQHELEPAFYGRSHTILVGRRSATELSQYTHTADDDATRLSRRVGVVAVNRIRN